MSYALDPDAAAYVRGYTNLYEFPGAEMLLVRFETDPAVVKHVLPNGLEPAPDAIGSAFVARYPETNFDCVYNEGAVFVECLRKGERGLYCLAMPVDDDMAMIGGREVFGYPKKMAERITLVRHGDHVVGSVIRRGTEIIRIEADLGDEVTHPALDHLGPPTTDADGRPAREVVSFLYKFFPSPDTRGFDYIPRLIRQPNLFRPRPGVRMGEGALHLRSSVRDPLGELPVLKVLDSFYGQFDNTMLPGEVVGHAWNLPHFVPHAFFKTDTPACRLARWRGEEEHAAEPPAGDVRPGTLEHTG
jgi:acetoacetate decarboxylase